MQGTPVWSLAQEDPTWREAAKSVHHIFWALTLCSPCSITREATAMRSRCAATRVAPAGHNRRKPKQSDKDQAQPKISTYIFNKNNFLSTVSSTAYPLEPQAVSITLSWVTANSSKEEVFSSIFVRLFPVFLSQKHDHEEGQSTGTWQPWFTANQHLLEVGLPVHFVRTDFRSLGGNDVGGNSSIHSAPDIHLGHLNLWSWLFYRSSICMQGKTRIQGVIVF